MARPLKIDNYTLRTEEIASVIRYFIQMTSAEKNTMEIEVSEAVYDAFLEAKRLEKKFQNEYDRHTEHSLLTDSELFCRAMKKHLGVEGAVENAELRTLMEEAVMSLPKIQRRRFILYFECELILITNQNI